MKAVKQALLLFVISVVAAFLVNLISPNSIAFIGEYRDLSSGDGPVIPPTAEEGDPPFIDINVAQMEHTTGSALFIDARDAEEYECATIPGAINVPFEQMPDDLDPYFDSIFGDVGRDYPLIVFCSGEECDLSLHLARTFQDFQFTNISIFFGGAREWENFELKMQRGAGCEE